MTDHRARRNDSVGLPRACLVLAACWALIGAALALLVFRAWMQPVPAFNPNDGPIGPDDGFSFLLGGALMAMPLVGLLAVLAVLASEYLKRAQAAGRTRTAWAGAVIAAIGADLAFLGTFTFSVPSFGMRLGQVDWGLVVLSAIFVVIGVAMIAVLTVASRGSRAGKPPRPVPRNS
jgi:hypothetical protein